MGFGFVVARFGLFLREIEAAQHLQSQSGHGVSLWLGIALVVLGVFLNLAALGRYRFYLRQLVLGIIPEAKPRLETGVAGLFPETEELSLEYAAPNPHCKGGVRFRLPAPAKPSAVFALLQGDPNRCYPAGYFNDGWVVKGLPAGTYDLMVVFDDRLCDGLTLAKGESALTKEDREAIQAILNKCEPYFETKVIQQAGGRGGKATALLQQMRTRPLLLQSGETRRDIQIRSFKIVTLKETPDGWKLILSREIMRLEVGGEMPRGVLPRFYIKELGNIRVTNGIINLGELSIQ
jgi:hypothetical protein